MLIAKPTGRLGVEAEWQTKNNTKQNKSYDTIFSLEPLSGRIWAKSKLSVTVSFSPKSALQYHCLAYCCVQGQEQRIPIKLVGVGVGPKAAFSYEEMDIGDIFVESLHRYEVDILNQGDIAVNYELVFTILCANTKVDIIINDDICFLKIIIQHALISAKLNFICSLKT